MATGTFDETNLEGCPKREGEGKKREFQRIVGKCARIKIKIKILAILFFTPLASGRT